MNTSRIGVLLALTALASVVSAGSASARRAHRVRVVHHEPHRFVFSDPDHANFFVFAGKVGGYFSPGILGASEADPYQHPSYGYYPYGGRGPGYSYYGD